MRYELTKTVFLAVVLAAAALDIFMPLVLGLKYEGYNHCLHTISALGARNSPVQKYQSCNLIAVGILMLIFAFGQHSAFTMRSGTHIMYILGIIIFGIGTIIAGLFPEDAPGAEETVGGKIHGIASGVGFLFLLMNPLWATRIEELRDYKPINALLFLFGAFTFALFLFSKNRPEGLLKYGGLLQRINLVILYCSLIINYLLPFKK